MPVVVKSPYASIDEGIRTAGSALSQALSSIGQRKREQLQKEKYGTILGETLAGLSPESSPYEIAQASSSLIQKGVPAETVKAAFAQYEPLIKQQVKTDADRKILSDLGLLPTDSQGMGMQPGAPSTTPLDAQQTPVGQRPISQWSEEELVLAQASGIPALQKMADAQLKRIDLQDKRAVAERTFRTEPGKEIQKKISALRESLPKKKVALSMARNAVETGEVGAFSLANLAQRMGIPELQTSSGAQLTTAAKENLLSNMGRVSARAQNLWFEQRLNSMFPQIGQSQEANLTTATMLEAEQAMDEAYLQAFDRIAAEDENRLGYVDYTSIEKRAREETEPIDKEIFDRSMFQLRQIYEKEKGSQWLIDNVMKKVPKGTPLTTAMASSFLYKYNGNTDKAIENAKKLGYTIHTRGEMDRWQ